MREARGRSRHTPGIQRVYNFVIIPVLFYTLTPRTTEQYITKLPQQQTDNFFSKSVTEIKLFSKCANHMGKVLKRRLLKILHWLLCIVSIQTTTVLCRSRFFTSFSREFLCQQSIIRGIVQSFP